MAILGWILLTLLGVLLLVLVCPVRIKVEHLGEWRGRVLLFGVIPVFSFPAVDKQEDKPAEEPPVSEKETVASAAKKPSILDELRVLFEEEGIGGVLGFFKRLLVLLQGTLSSVKRFITVRKLALCVRVGGEQADDTAVRCGQLGAALAASLTALCEIVRVRRPKVRVVPDFTADKIDVKLRLIVWVWPFGVLGALIAALCKLLLLWFHTVKTPPVGAADTDIQKPLSK